MCGASTPGGGGGGAADRGEVRAVAARVEALEARAYTRPLFSST